ncbi:MAG: ABC transporter ATP-binding protein [Thermodesulfobacteriota bacterium]
MPEPLLSLENVHTHLGRHHILQGVSLSVAAGRPTVLLGRNGAGKTTTLRTIMGLSPPSSGRLRLDGRDIAGLRPYKIARLGLGYVPEEQAVFYHLTVEENFRLAMLDESDVTRERLDRVLELFPDLKKFWRSKAGVLSGGQKQMLAIGRVFANDHRLLIVDEPSKGLAPIIVDHLIEALNRMKDHTTIILVEQNFYMASRLGQDYFILDDGRVARQGLMADLVEDHDLKKKYLGIGK